MLSLLESAIDRLPPRTRTFARYVVCGGTSTLLHYSILTALVELGGVNETLSTTIGYFSSSFVNYMLLYHWAFRSTVVHLKATIRYFSVAAGTLLLNSMIFWVMFQVVGLWYLLAQAVTTVLVLSVTFTVNSRYTFTRE